MKIYELNNDYISLNDRVNMTIREIVKTFGEIELNSCVVVGEGEPYNRVVVKAVYHEGDRDITLMDENNEDCFLEDILSLADKLSLLEDILDGAIRKFGKDAVEAAMEKI